MDSLGHEHDSRAGGTRLGGNTITQTVVVTPASHEPPTRTLSYDANGNQTQMGNHAH